jgi:hypothetical protein
MCLSLGDYDDDGRLDLYSSDFLQSSDHLWHDDSKGFLDEVSEEDSPLVLHNSGRNENHFLNLKVLGKKSNRDAMGASIRVVSGTMSQIRDGEGPRVCQLR